MKPGHPSSLTTSPASKTLAAAGGTLASRFLGLARDMLVAWVLGAGADIFIVAFRIPNIVRRIAAEGSLGLAYATTLGRLMPTSLFAGEAIRVCRRTSLAFAALGLGLALVLALWPMGTIALVAPGLLGRESLPVAVLCLLLSLPFLPMAGFGAVLSATLVAGGKMAQAAMAPLFLNAGILVFGLVALLAITPLPQAAWFALGVSAGGILQCLWLLWHCRVMARQAAHRKGAEPPKTCSQASVGGILRQTPTALFTSCGTQLHFVIAAAAASFLQEGSIAALYFAERLVEFPLMLAGAVPAMVMAPDFARQQGQTLANSLAATLRLGLFCSIPAAIGLFFLATPLVMLFFGHGAFSAEKTAASGQVLACMALSLPFICMVRPLAAAIAALPATEEQGSKAQKMATKATLWSLLATGLTCATLTPLLGLVGTGLALNTGAVVQAILLYRILAMAGVAETLPALGNAILPVIFGALVLGIGLALLPDLASETTSAWWLAGCIGGISLVAGFGWIAVYTLLGNAEAVALWAAFRDQA